VLSSVVRIVATVQGPDFDSPWQARTPTKSSGTGCVIEGGRVLAAAHAIANASWIELHRVTGGPPCRASVIAVNHDCDLALLAPADPAWLANAEPVRIGELPALRTPIFMFGATEGGHWVRDGIVSKIDTTRYTHSQRVLLALVLDIDMTESAGAGPVFDDDRLVGICVQKVTDENRIGEVVPPPIITAFLAGVRDGKPPRIPGLGITTQNTQNARLRQQLQLADDYRGVLVIQVEVDGSADGVLACGDVLVAIDDIPIASDGTISYAETPPHRYDAIVGEHHVGDRISVELVRDGARRRVELALRDWTPLVPRSRYERVTDYLVWGGLVFQPLTRDYLTTWDEWWNKAPKEFLDHYYRGMRTAERHEVVIVSTILDDDVNTGYAHLYNESITRVNGRLPRDFADFAATLESATGLVRLETSSGGVVVMHTNDVRAATPAILERYQIPRARSYSAS
jgi:S1-C subfamily serine protease